MTPRHHLDSATVVAFAAGTLSPALAAVAASHLEVCAQCRQQVRKGERLGGLLLEQQQPGHASHARRESLRQDILAQLDEAPVAPPASPFRNAIDGPREADPDRLPVSLHAYFGETYSALRWRWMGPGMHMIRAQGLQQGQLILLKIAAGKSMPIHSHGGSELTQILKGAYTDALGRFAVGDVADLDSEVEHQPVTVPGVACICVSALDAPLRFPGWLARKLQPLIGL
ncbi:ChrR family anti-sigma-E factor [Pseudoxanthomonas indica]|uniref:Anti-ECFsigma factor, ChrR n=1 Tax=Pseudoxanthomonas indica TaxID=428993 RepID=A0A1T5ITT5_9GAMM|nr:ChrR family anti-sigma-E factor [Pseudoxanthomonas indica]GGD54299.1 transcriptional regulator [Pseudoxanthomonas indica]SKC42579.1 anti-ECFsigma factor, ChrR [Pseudoxanthomonas indica]